MSVQRGSPPRDTFTQALRSSSGVSVSGPGKSISSQEAFMLCHIFKPDTRIFREVYVFSVHTNDQTFKHVSTNLSIYEGCLHETSSPFLDLMNSCKDEGEKMSAVARRPRD